MFENKNNKVYTRKPRKKKKFKNLTDAVLNDDNPVTKAFVGSVGIIGNPKLKIVKKKIK